MLPTKNKIPRDLFEQFFKKTRVFYGNSLSLRHAVNTYDKNNRFSFVVPKAVSKSAVKRNLIRRRGYSILEKQLKQIKEPNIGIFLAQKGLEKMPYKEMEEEILLLLKKAKYFDF